MMIRQITSSKDRRVKTARPWKKATAALCTISVVLGIFYLVGMNDLIVKGFALKDLKSQASLLAQENQDLQAKALTLQSYAVMSPRLQGLNMVQVEDVDYFTPQAQVVAKK